MIRAFFAGQHYAPQMSSVLFIEFVVRETLHDLHVGSDTLGAQTVAMLHGIERPLIGSRHEIALVRGGTNSTLAGGLETGEASSSLPSPGVGASPAPRGGEHS